MNINPRLAQMQSQPAVDKLLCRQIFTSLNAPFLLLGLLYDKFNAENIGFQLKANWSTEAVTSHYC